MKNLMRTVLAMFVLLALATFGWAQEDTPIDDQPVQQQDQRPAPDERNVKDAPGRAVRLQYMSGSVSVQPNGTEDWVEGTLNRPLTNSDNIWADKSSRAELNVGTGMLRMGDETSLTLTNISNSTVQVQLHQGTLNVHVRHLFPGEIYEIDTPNTAFTVQKSGDYRFDVDPNGDATVVTVRKGEGDATGQGPGVRVHSDQQVRFSDGTSMTHVVAEAPAYDGFDSWCAVRDKRLDSSQSARYVAAGTVGYEDLDDNGVWQEEPPYGRVWVPRVAPGWAPYQYGHWIWVEPWGWTWVDDAPWGYAPFHYGRWVYASGYWGWAPGPVYVQPVYAPALVTWFGGPGWGVSLGFGFGGGFGWCPLGWGEPFFPWYGYSRGYFSRVNITNTHITNINNYYGHPPNRFGQGSFRYANMHAPGGLTAVPSRTLAGGMAVHGSPARVSARDFANAPMGRVGVTPGRGAMLGASAGRTASMPPARSGMRPTVSRMTPPGGFGRGATANGAGNRPFAGRNESSALTPSRMIPHGPESATGRVPSPALRGVPRPPSAGGQRPATGNPEIARGEMSRGGFPSSNMQRSVPRPPSGYSPRASSPAMQNAPSRMAMESTRNRPTTSVPRPTGPVRPASQYNQMERGGYGGSSRQPSNSPSYRGGGYNAPSRQPSYSPSNRGGYGGGSPRYSAPSSSGPSYRGGGAPSYHSGGGGAPSYHGGGGGGGSYHGGGGGGGGHTSSGGGHSGHR